MSEPSRGARCHLRVKIRLGEVVSYHGMPSEAWKGAPPSGSAVWPSGAV
jgi:hypothetical protein